MAVKQLARTFKPLSSHAFVSPVPASDSAEKTGPVSSSSSTGNVEPDVVLVFGWMDAQLPHLYKYTEGYHALFPFAEQVLVRSDQWFFWRSQKARDAAIRPVLKILRDHGIENLHSPSARVLIHIMSNGGAFQFANLLKLMPTTNTTTTTSSPSPPHNHTALVFDSAPGLGTFKIAATAMTAPIKSPLLRTLAYYPIGALYYLNFLISRYVLRHGDPFVTLHETLTDPALIPTSVPRLYFYSTPDELVPYEHVESHIDEVKERARAAGQGAEARIMVRRDEKAAHVSHLRMDPEGYWASILKLWRSTGNA